MFTRIAARKTESIVERLPLFLSIGFFVQIVNSPMEGLEEGFSWKSNLKRKCFYWVIVGREEQLKSPTSTTWWKFRREKTQCSLTIPVRRTLAWRGLSTTRTNQLPPTVEWKRSTTTRADHIASSWQLVLIFHVGLIFQNVEQSCVVFFFENFKQFKLRWFSCYRKKTVKTTVKIVLTNQWQCSNVKKTIHSTLNFRFGN